MLSKFINRYIGSGSRGSVVKKNAIGALLIKIFAMGIQIIQVPIVLSYLDKETYGVYLTITSLIIWAQNFDFGLGGGLRYKLTESLANKDFKRSRELVSTAYISLATILTLVGIVSTIISNYIDFNSLLNCNDISNKKLTLCVLAVLYPFLIQLVLDLITVVLQANQKTAISTIFRPVAHGIAVIGVICLKHYSYNNLFEACLVLTIPILATLLIANIWLFAGKFRQISPSFKYFNKGLVKDIYSLGLKLFISSLSTMVIFNSANLILSYYINPIQVSVYNTTYTYFSVIIVFHAIILTPLWPAITDAYVKKDFAWLRSCMNRLSEITIIFSCFSIIAFLISGFIFKIWLGNKLDIPTSIVLILCIYSIGNIWSATYNCFIVGVGKALATMYLSVVKIIVYLPVSIFMVKNMGIIGLVCSIIIINTIPNIILSYIQYRKIVAGKASGVWLS